MEQESDPKDSPFVVPEDDVPEGEEESVEGEHSPPPELQEDADDA